MPGAPRIGSHPHDTASPVFPPYPAEIRGLPQNVTQNRENAWLRVFWTKATQGKIAQSSGKQRRLFVCAKHTGPGTLLGMRAAAANLKLILCSFSPPVLPGYALDIYSPAGGKSRFLLAFPPMGLPLCRRTFGFVPCPQAPQDVFPGHSPPP